MYTNDGGSGAPRLLRKTNMSKAQGRSQARDCGAAEAARRAAIEAERGGA